MLGIFGKKAKSPAEVSKHLKDNLVVLQNEKNPKHAEKAAEQVSNDLGHIKFILYGDPEHEKEPNQDQINTLLQAFLQEDVLPLIVSNIAKMEFEAKKDAASIFNNLLRRQSGNRYIVVDYIEKKHPEILSHLVNGYENSDIALNCGSMLRECVRHEPLAKIVLANDFYKLFTYVDRANFDVASDAFATFKDLSTKHKTLCAEFLEKNYDEIFAQYTVLLNSQNYVTKRQSLKLLGELLLDKANFNVMMKYISSQDNLKLMMNLLRDKSRNIQFEAFHVFKVFVANPTKTKPILEILVRNREKLVAFLTNFHNDKEDDQFTEEKAFLLKQISQLPATTD